MASDGRMGYTCPSEVGRFQQEVDHVKGSYGSVVGRYAVRMCR